MKIIGVIAEYNPFHLGHKYQIDKIKELYPDSIIIAIVSTNFTERGEISILNKWDKAKICLDNNIDIVVELPTLYATQASDMFAYGSINILNNLGIDTLIFGSESDNVSDLELLADTQLHNSKYDKLVKMYLDKGINYPTAMSKALYDLTNKMISEPNDLLALSYIKEIKRNNYNIEPISIKRTNDYHSKDINNEILPASLIRELYRNNKDISKYVPKSTQKCLNKPINDNDIYNYLLYIITLYSENLGDYLTVDEGIHNRIIKSIRNSHDLDELINKIKTKRYTYNKIKRMLIHILLGIKKEDNNYDTYLRIMGFNKRGRKYLNSIKKNMGIPVFDGYKPNVSNVLDIEFKSTCVYALITNNKDLIEREYKYKPIIK